eukprot:g5121.t1
MECLKNVEGTNEEYKRYLGVFARLIHRKRIQSEVTSALLVGRYAIASAHLEANRIEYNICTSMDETRTEQIVQSSTKQALTRRKCDRRLAKTLLSEFDFRLHHTSSDLRAIATGFAEARSPQMYVECVQKLPAILVLPARSVSFDLASKTTTTTASSAESVDVRRLIGDDVEINGCRTPIRSMDGLVSTMADEMLRLDGSFSGFEDAERSKDFSDEMIRFLLQSSEHAAAGAHIFEALGDLLLPDAEKGAISSELALFVPTKDTKSDVAFDFDVGCFRTLRKREEGVVAGKDQDDDEFDTADDGCESSSDGDGDDEENRPVRERAVATMRREEVRRMIKWLAIGQERCTLKAYIEATEDRVRRKGHAAEDFIRENDAAWGLRSSWKEAVKTVLSGEEGGADNDDAADNKDETRQWYWGVRGRARVRLRIRIFPNDSLYISKGKEPWAHVDTVLETRVGLPILHRGPPVFLGASVRCAFGTAGP